MASLAMKLTCDKESDTLLLVLTKNEIEETEEIRPGILADIDKAGSLVSLEILNASRKVDTLKELIASHSPVEVEMV